MGLLAELEVAIKDICPDCKEGILASRVEEDPFRWEHEWRKHLWNKCDASPIRNIIERLKEDKYADIR